MLSSTVLSTPDTKTIIPPSHCAYLPTIKKAVSHSLQYGLAIGTTLSTAIYSLGFPSKTQPATFSWKWWEHLDKPTKFYSVSSAIINFMIGVMVRLAYLPKIANTLKQEFQQSMQSGSQAAKNSVILFLGLIAALAGGALVYEGFIAMGPLVASINALANMLIIAGFRFVSLSLFFKNIIDYFNTDLQFQRDCIKQLKKLSSQHADELALLLQGKELNEETVNAFLVAFYDQACLAEINSQPTSYLSAISGKVIDWSFGLSLGAPYLLFFSQKGLDGIKIIMSHLAPSATINALSTSAKMAISLIIGSSSGVLAFLSGHDMRELMIQLYDDCKTHPFDIIKILVLLPATTISALSLTSAVEAMTALPNIFAIHDNEFGTLFTVLLTLMAVCFDFKAVSEMYILDHPEDHVKVKHIVGWLEKNNLSDDTIQALKQHAFFANIPLEKQEKITDTKTALLTSMHVAANIV